MSELTKTLLFCLVAAVLVTAAALIDPGARTPEIFTDQGELFYPGFTDPQAPKTIEVVDYDEATATARPLKVEFRNKKWILPSHFGYPADAERRLAETAAALVELRKDAIISDRVEDQSRCGVIDPLDPKATSLSGRGKRVTLRDEDGTVLADFVIGKAVEDKPGYRYLRVPGQRRIYGVRTDADVSARFEDWIETDLLKLSAADVRRVDIHRYSINEELGILENVENLTLVRNQDQWSISGGGAPRKEKMDELLGALDNLRIVDVQRKPLGLTEDLKTPEGIRLSSESVLSLRQKGFFVTPLGQLLSNEGEIRVETANGLEYFLRFGEIAPGGADSSALAGGGEGEAANEKVERRYLFITVRHSSARAQRYGQDGGAQGKALERELRNRFAEWYYIISGADFEKLRPRRRDLSGR